MDIDQLIAFCQEEQEENECEFQQVTIDEAMSSHELNNSCADSQNE